MNETTQLLVSHGPPLVFVAVFLEQMGLPLPAAPWLLAAGALSATGKFSPLMGYGVTVLACLLADTFWFYFGRYRGHRVLGLLCRISLEPDACVRRTQGLFTRYGLRGVAVAKFVPGLSTVAAPLAGMSGVNLGRFLLADGFGSLLYGGCFLFAGYLFSNQIQQIAAALPSIGGGALGLVIGLATLSIGFKYWQRQQILRESVRKPGEAHMTFLTAAFLSRSLPDASGRLGALPGSTPTGSAGALAGGIWTSRRRRRGRRRSR